MRYWDFDKRPYRPVVKASRGEDGKVFEEQPDAFTDAMGRVWYAGTPDLIMRLPGDPMRELTIPSEFWHPDLAKHHSATQHAAKKRQMDDERAEQRWGA